MYTEPVPIDFFTGPTLELARRLLGCLVVHELDGQLLAGKIVEVEAYLGALDQAAHSYRGMTHRTRAMFGPPGHAYIYLSYGMHYCLNVTAGSVGVGEGVLLRAIEPIKGQQQMQQLRGAVSEMSLTNGPGKLVQALGVTKDLYGHDLTRPPLFIAKGDSEKVEIEAGPRVGISKAKEQPWRFWIKGSKWVSV